MIQTPAAFDHRFIVDEHDDGSYSVWDVETGDLVVVTRNHSEVRYILQRGHLPLYRGVAGQARQRGVRSR